MELKRASWRPSSQQFQFCVIAGEEAVCVFLHWWIMKESPGASLANLPDQSRHSSKGGSEKKWAAVGQEVVNINLKDCFSEMLINVASSFFNKICCF